VTSTEATIEVTVPPRFCDSQGMVHASRYQEFLEDAFLHWLAGSGLPYATLSERGLDLVIGTITIRYVQPGRLQDRLEVRVRPTASTTSTVSVSFTISRGSSLVAEASTTYIAVRAGRSTPLPEELTIRGG
jgi:YbgC/YbaW family acyl-CoA thioester hydrolase